MSDKLLEKIIDYGAMILIALISGFLPNWLSHIREKRNKRVEILIELYKNVCYWCNAMMNIFINFFLVIDGVSDWDKYLDNIRDYKVKGDPLKIKIIINLYFPKLKPAFDRLFKVVTEANSFINITIKEDYKKGENIKKYKTELDGRNNDFCNAKRDLENQIMEISSQMSEKYGITE